MDPLYNLAHAYLHDQTDANAKALVKWCQEEYYYDVINPR